MEWYEITVNADSEGTELIADAFFSIGCMGGVKIIDKNDIIDIMENHGFWDYIDENLLSQNNVVKISGFVSKEEINTKLEELQNCLKERNVSYSEINITKIDDDDWYDNWKKYYSPIDADNYVIVPKWMNYDNKNNKIIILMDPGMAFGTGEHESTKLCLKLMSGENFEGKTVIDVGTGSGILGIGAVKSNALSCYMCDIDSVAVKASIENCRLNNVLNKVTIECADLLEKSDKKGDIVLANLTADILIRLAERLPEHIQKGGILICSGIIDTRKEEVINLYCQKSFKVEQIFSMGEWFGIKFRY